MAGCGSVGVSSSPGSGVPRHCPAERGARVAQVGAQVGQHEGELHRVVVQHRVEVGPEVHREGLPLTCPACRDELGREARGEAVGEVLGKGEPREGLVHRVGRAGALRLFRGVDRLVAEAEGPDLEAEGPAPPLKGKATPPQL